MSTLSQYIRMVLEGRSPDSKKGGPLGKWAWASSREGIDEEEPDNRDEKYLKRHLSNHFQSNHRGLPKRAADMLQRLLKSKKYKTVLHPPPCDKLYRGIYVRGKQHMVDLLGIDVNDLTDDGKMDVKTCVDVKNGHSTSWSAKKAVARDFSNKYNKAVWGYSVVLIADVKDKKNADRFVAGPGGLYDVDGISRFHNEKETLGIEPITISRIEWVKIGPV